MADLNSQPTVGFVSRQPWNPDRPHVLVVACSDGRLQVNLDEFLDGHLGIQHYDRLYLPGGPGALATSGVEYVRSDLHRRELTFLLAAHVIEVLLLIFHGPASDGPNEALCADYVRIFGRADAAVINAMQEKDLAEIVDLIHGKAANVDVRGFRCEVGPGGAISFVEMATVDASESPTARRR